jgi:N utilization substance protein B
MAATSVASAADPVAARTKARKRALDILYGSDLRGLELDGMLEQAMDDRDLAGAPPLNDYSVVLVRGVRAHQERIDEILEDYAVDWTLARMPAVDRNLLRIGAYELLAVDDLPDAVAISEAVGLAAELSTDESPGFINGILGRIAENKPSLAAIV